MTKVYYFIFLLLIYIGLNNKASGQNLDSALANKLPNIKKDSLSLNLPKINKPVLPSLPDSNAVPKLKWQAPVFGGRMGIEGYYTTFQNPRVLSAPQYLRFNATPTVSWYGLPFMGDIYQTTEKNTLYNSNHIRFRFDAEAFQRNLKLQFQHKLQEQKAKLGNDIGQLNELGNLNAGLEQQKQNLFSQQNQLQQQYQNQLQAYKNKYDPNNIENTLRDTAGGILNPYKDSANNLIEGQKQNATERAMQAKQKQMEKAKDSATLARLRNDSALIAERIAQIESKKQELQSKKARLDSAYTKDTALVNKYTKIVENPQAYAKSWAKENGLPKAMVWATSVKDLQIGNVQLFIHDYSIAGSPMRGFSGTFGVSEKPDKADITILAGRSIPNDILHYSRENSKYERNTFALAGAYKINAWMEIKPFVHYMADNQKSMTAQQKAALRNTVYGFNLFTEPRKIIKLDISAAQSRYEVTNIVIKSTVYPKGSVSSLSQTQLSRSAYKIMGEKTLGKFTLNASTQFVGPIYKNLGNPYMRTNFREEKMKLVFKGFQEQLSLTGSYKSFRDNPLLISEVTNKIQGYGFAAQTRFKNKKLPNFSASISPYEQGNNHPDSLFRINNRFSVYTAGMTYRINRGFFKYNLMIYGTQSNMQMGDSIKAMVKTITFGQDISLGRNFGFGLTNTIMRTYPGVDSSQANIYQLRASYRVGKFATLTLTGNYTQYLNGAFRKGGSLIFSIQQGKHLRVSLRSGYDHYYRLWGLSNEQALWGLVRIDWIL